MGSPAHPGGRRPFETEPLLEHLEDVGRELNRAGRWSLLLDFDGTLAPIVDRPEDARIPEATLATLRELGGRREGLVAIISGRPIDDVRTRVGLDSLYYAGNHGLEISGPGGVHFLEPMAYALQDRLAQRTRTLRRGLDDLPGAVVEAKGLTTSVHFRRVDPTLWTVVRDRVAAIVPPDDPWLAIHGGKCVHEIRPRVEWGKGHACLWLLRTIRRTGDVCMFLGDDLTDENAFIALGEGCVTARVEPFVQTHASFRLGGTEQVAFFLAWLASRKSRNECDCPDH